VPGTAAAQSHLRDDEIEIGMGIHNEPGNNRVSPVPLLRGLVQQLLDLLLTTTDPERSYLPLTGNDDDVVLMVNNLGGVSELEFGSIVREVEKGLSGRHVHVERVLSGTFMVRISSFYSTVDCPYISWLMILSILSDDYTCRRV